MALLDPGRKTRAKCPNSGRDERYNTQPFTNLFSHKSLEEGICCCCIFGGKTGHGIR